VVKGIGILNQTDVSSSLMRKLTVVATAEKTPLDLLIGDYLTSCREACPSQHSKNCQPWSSLHDGDNDQDHSRH
jgi:hypothetical protein